jgi:O-acetyl-ADP-ribose deacetylase (regulator of RNase III)
MIEVVRGELAGAGTPGVLRPVTAEWTAVTPAMRRLDPLLGPEVVEQCQRMGELPIGTAIVTGAGAIPADLLIHVVIRSATQPVTPGNTARGLLNGLRRAEEWGIEALALPPLGTGAGNLDAEESADIMVPILLEWMRSERPPRRVVVVVETDYEYDAFERRIRREDSAGPADLPLLDT